MYSLSWLSLVYVISSAVYVFSVLIVSCLTNLFLTNLCLGCLCMPIKRRNNVAVPDHEITTVLSLIVWRVRNVSSHGRACVTFQPAPHHHWQSNSPTLLMISFSLTGLGVGELLQLTIIVVTDWSLEEGGQQVERIIIWGADIIRQTPGFTFYLRVNPPVIKTWWSEV